MVEAQAPFGGERGQLAAERGPLGRAGAVMDHEFGAAPPQFRDHRHDRCDADATRDQEMPFACRVEREIVARDRHLEDIAGPDMLVQMARAPATRAFAQHRDTIAPPLGRVVPQRILPQKTAGPQLDMGTGRKARQVAAARVDQLIAVGGFGEIGDRPDAQLHGPGLLQILPLLGKDRADREELNQGGD